jgi:hypothetical protein
MTFAMFNRFKLPKKLANPSDGAGWKKSNANKTVDQFIMNSVTTWTR